MKRILIIILAAAALSACTKSSVELEQSEIGVSPFAGNMTKAAQQGGYPTDQHIAVWAYLGSAEASDYPDKVVDYSNFNYPYFSGQEFYYKTADNGNKAWGGLQEAYFWPGHGSLVFAGCALPAPKVAGNPSGQTYSIEYEFYNYPDTGTTETLNAGLVDKMTITSYAQSANTAETFDLMWFGVTSASYNYRTSGTPVAITFNHALSWITFKVYGDGAPAAEATAWQVNSLIMEDVNTTGNVECVGSVATWSNVATPLDMTIFSGSKTLTTGATEIENVKNGTVIIPQKPGMLTVTFTSGGTQTTKQVSLQLTENENDAANVWKPGYHYTYTLVFKANEILVAPTFDPWGEKTDNTITVQ